ncbi:hypothetical protein LDENG_00053840 [Lucifuga dentata]|nr:hypothetical protein LDENG_00053840 [Lucifuga dentata]
MSDVHQTAEAVYDPPLPDYLLFDTGSLGPDDIFEEKDFCFLSSISSSSSSSVPAMTFTQEKPLCSSCGMEIVDTFLLKVNNLCWHERCLSCSMCKTSLSGHMYCYIKDKQVFCKLDYFRRYRIRCARCGRNIHSTDWVRRARGRMFHLACFSCASCKRQLATGEKCGFLANRVFCQQHYDVMMEKIRRAKEKGEWRD